MQRPINDATSLLAASDEAWRSLVASDWMEAFHKPSADRRAHRRHRLHQLNLRPGRRRNNGTWRTRPKR